MALQTFQTYAESLDDIKLQERIDKYRFHVEELRKQYLPEHPHRASAEALLSALEGEAFDRTLLGVKDERKN